MSIVTYPLNGITYDAEDAQTYLCTRTSGVFDTENDFELSVTDDMEVTISSGQAWIKYADYRGISVCSDSSTVLTVPTASSLDRIDRVVLRFDRSNNLSELVIVEGTAASSPSAPDIEQDELIYELGLYTIAVAASTTSISSDDITDTRTDTDVCGLMKDPVTSASVPANAQTADALTTARSIQVDLTSIEAASFDGTADITPGVTGALPLANGGTGAVTGPLGLYALINACSTLTSSTLATGDYVALGDVSASTGKKITVTNLITYLRNNLELFTVGTYSGSVAYTSTTTQTISLGFEPSFVLVLVVSDDYDGAEQPPWQKMPLSESYSFSYTTQKWYGGFCTPDAPMYILSGAGETSEVLYTSSSGFVVRNCYYASGKAYSQYGYLNRSGYTYIYLATR